MMTVFKREPREGSRQRQGSPSVSKVSSHLACPCQQDLLPGRKRVSGYSVASAVVSTPGAFVGLTFPFCEMGMSPPLWQAAVSELTQTRLTNRNTELLEAGAIGSDQRSNILDAQEARSGCQLRSGLFWLLKRIMNISSDI